MKTEGPYSCLLFLQVFTICFFVVKGFFKAGTDNSHTEKMIELAKDFSYLSLILRFLGPILGLITAFDALEAMGNVDPAVFAGGLKVALLTSTFGLLTAALTKIGIVGLRLLSRA